MVGSQIRIFGPINPYYTITSVLSPTTLTVDSPWAGPDLVSKVYQIVKLYYTVPDDFGYFYVVTSPKDGYRLWTNITESELGLMDSQRTTMGQTYAVVFKDYTPIYGGSIGQPIPVAATGPGPVTASTTGYSYPANTTYIIQVLTSDVSGAATFQWMRAGQLGFTGPVVTSDQLTDLMDGVQVYWPDGITYNAGDLFIVNTIASVMTGGMRYELWPAPTFPNYLYPYMYIARESDLTVQQPSLPPPVSQRGEVLLEMALASCARFPGSDAEHENIYFNLALAGMHETRVASMMVDFERNDEEVGVTNISYESLPWAPAPWLDGSWQQRHAPTYY